MTVFLKSFNNTMVLLCNKGNGENHVLTSSDELNIDMEKKDSLFGSTACGTDLGFGINSGPSLQQQPDHVGISSFRCHMERCDVILSQ